MMYHHHDYSDEVEEQFHIHEAAINEANTQNDRITSWEHQLEQIALLEADHKSLQFRYDGFYVLFEVLMAREPWPLSTSFVTTLTNKFVNNVEEPIFFRAIASYILGYNYENNALDPFTSIHHFQSAITFCKEATPTDRQRQIELPDFLGGGGGGDPNKRTTKSVGEILDSIEKDSTFHRDYQKDPQGTHGTLMDILSKATTGSGGSLPGEAEEILQFLSDIEDFNMMPKKSKLKSPPPTTTTPTIIATSEKENNRCDEHQHSKTPPPKLAPIQDSTEEEHDHDDISGNPPDTTINAQQTREDQL